MKKITSFIFSILVSSVLFFPGRTGAEDKWDEAAEAIESGLLGCWNFNEAEGKTVIDASGNKHNGALVKTEREIGLQGNALRFNGKDAYVDCGKNAGLNSAEALSVQVWFSADSGNASEQCLLDKTGGYSVFFNAGQNRVRIGVRGSNGKFVDLGSSLKTGRGWHQVVLTYDRKIPDNNLKLYVNGQLQAEKRLPEGICAATDTTLFIGRSAAGNFYQGLLDEVKIYNRVLSAGEIKEFYSAATRQTPVL